MTDMSRAFLCHELFPILRRSRPKPKTELDEIIMEPEDVELLAELQEDALLCGVSD